MPKDLQHIFGAPTPFVRVPHGIAAKQATKHVDVLEYFERLSEILPEWVGYQARDDRWEILLRIRSQATYWPLLIVIGRDRDGSYNLVTVHRRNPRWERRFATDPKTRWKSAE